MSVIGNINVDLRANSAAFSRDLAKASTALKSSSARMNKSISAVERGFLRTRQTINKSLSSIFSFKGAIAALTGASGLALLVKSSISAADEIGKTADKLGIGTGALQEYRFAASQSGVETRTLDLALQRFTRRVAEAAQGKGELKDVLVQYGIAARDAAGRTRDSGAVLNDLADAIKNAESPAERLRIAFKAFDSEGAAFVNALTSGSRGLEELRRQAREAGVVLEDSLVRRAEEATKQLDVVGKQIKIAFSRVVIESVDSLTWSITALSKSLVVLSNSFGAVDKWLDETLGGKLSGTVTEETLKRLHHDERILQRLMSTMDQSTDEYEKAAERLQRVRYSISEWEKRLAANRTKKIEPPETGTRVPGPGDLTATAAGLEDVNSLIGVEHKQWRSLKEISKAAIEEQNRQLAVQKELLQESVIALSARNTAEGEHSLALKAADERQAMAETAAAAVKAGSTIREAFDDAISSVSYSLSSFLVEGKRSFSEFAESVLEDLARIGLQRAITAGAGSLFGGFGALFAGLFHEGGVAGAGGASRRVPAALFAGAPRLHDGLAPGEYPAILQRGEWVIPGDKIGRAGGNVEINVVNKSGQRADIRETAGVGGKRVVSIVIGDEIASGRLDKVMKQAYGLKRRGRTV